MINYIPYDVYDGITNMQIDEKLLDDSIKNNSKPSLRLYGWSKPTLTIGRNQILNGINLEFCKKNGIEIVRRITGGRAVLHQHEITYCFVTPVNFLNDGNSIISSYKEISQVLINSFEELGVKLEYPGYKKVTPTDGYCMSISTGSDLSYYGKKLIGSAQFRKQNYILQHGSILLDIDTRLLKDIFYSDISDSKVTTIKQINPDLLNINAICDVIKKNFAKI